MGRLVDLLSTGVSLAVEATNSKMGHSSQQQPRQTSSQRPSSGTIVSNAQQYLSSRSLDSRRRPASFSMQNAKGTRRDYDDRDIDDSTPPDYYYSQNSSPDPYLSREPFQSSGRLPYPIIIPQRRPEDKSRGWMLAYAPVLDEFGIDQTTFLKFLYDFNESHKSSPYLDAVNLAAFGVGFAPGIAPMVISTAVPLAVSYSKKAQTERLSNSYLGRMNSELFEPCGLYAVVMTLQPTDQATLTVDSATANVVGGQYGLYRNFDYNGNGYTPPDLPASAPLVFPSPQDIAMIRSQGNRLKEMGHFSANYLDRRAQARYAQSNPNSGLSISDIGFSSFMSDPRSAGSNSGLLGQLTGGPLSRQKQLSPKEMEKETEKQEKKARKKFEKSNKGGLIKSMISKAAMSSDVLYLMIVESPPDDNMVDASLPPTTSSYAPQALSNQRFVGNLDDMYAQISPPIPPRRQINDYSSYQSEDYGNRGYRNGGYDYGERSLRYGE